MKVVYTVEVESTQEDDPKSVQIQEAIQNYIYFLLISKLLSDSADIQ